MGFIRDDGQLLWVSPPSVLTDDVVRQITGALSRRLQQNLPYAALFDLGGAGVPTAVQRQMLAAHMRKNSELIQRWVRGMAVIAPSPLVRGVATAIFWLERPRVPHDVFATSASAEAWARERIAADR